MKDRPDEIRTTDECPGICQFTGERCPPECTTTYQPCAKARAPRTTISLLPLSADQREYLKQLRSATVKPGDPRLNERVGGSKTTDPIDRLQRWCDVGDGPASYVAGSQEFGDDVKAALLEIERLREVVLLYVDPHQVKPSYEPIVARCYTP